MRPITIGAPDYNLAKNFKRRNLIVFLFGVVPLVRGHVAKHKISIFDLTKLDEHWFSRYQSHENIVSVTSLGIVDKPT